MSEQLTRSFFEAELPKLKAAFVEETGTEKVTVDLILKAAGAMRLEGDPVCADTYLAFDRKQGAQISRTVLLYEAILGVSLSAENEKRVGFHR
jgi:hypothetical protein